MECFTLTSGVQATEELNGRRLRRSGERKHGNIGLFPVAANLVSDHIFDIKIANFNLAGTERHGNCCHIFTGCGRMCLVDDDSESLTFEPRYAVNDIRELLYCGSDDLRVSVQRNRKVSRIALVIHNTD